MPRILVIDDDYQIRTMLRQYLESEGYKVKEATDGISGLAILREFPIDLAIVDLIMPNKEGLETIPEIQRDFKGLKVIAISGGGRIGPSSYLPMAQSLGANRTFAKPFDLDEIAMAIRELLEDDQT
jgi:DNA-binding response OmpR family regulator